MTSNDMVGHFLTGRALNFRIYGQYLPQTPTATTMTCACASMMVQFHAIKSALQWTAGFVHTLLYSNVADDEQKQSYCNAYYWITNHNFTHNFNHYSMFVFFGYTGGCWAELWRRMLWLHGFSSSRKVWLQEAECTMHIFPFLPHVPTGRELPESRLRGYARRCCAQCQMWMPIGFYAGFICHLLPLSIDGHTTVCFNVDGGLLHRSSWQHLPGTVSYDTNSLNTVSYATNNRNTGLYYNNKNWNNVFAYYFEG